MVVVRQVDDAQSLQPAPALYIFCDKVSAWKHASDKVLVQVDRLGIDLLEGLDLFPSQSQIASQSRYFPNYSCRLVQLLAKSYSQNFV